MTSIRVEGLAELRRDLRKAERTEDLRELQRGFRRAAEIVSDEAKMRANTFSFRLADTIRPGTSGNRAFVRGGKAAYPWYGWADFGSRSPRRGQSRSVGPWAGSGRGPRNGRFIYPAIEAKERQVVAAVEEAMSDALNRLDLPEH